MPDLVRAPPPSVLLLFRSAERFWACSEMSISARNIEMHTNTCLEKSRAAERKAARAAERTASSSSGGGGGGSAARASSPVERPAEPARPRKRCANSYQIHDGRSEARRCCDQRRVRSACGADAEGELPRAEGH